jgi:hypothetical protein
MSVFKVAVTIKLDSYKLADSVSYGDAREQANFFWALGGRSLSGSAVTGMAIGRELAKRGGDMAPHAIRLLRDIIYGYESRQ